MTTDNGNVKAAVSCPSEDGGKTVKNGRQGGWQRYLCKECGSQFRELDVIGRGSRFPIEQVGAALQEYYEGMTYRQTARNVGTAFGIKPPGRGERPPLGPEVLEGGGEGRERL